MKDIPHLLDYFFDWSEAWAPLIPLFVLAVHRHQPKVMTPVIVYLVLVLPVNALCNVIADFKLYLPDWLQENTYLYNVHSVTRFICFTYFFIGLKQDYYTNMKRVIAIVYVLFLVIDLRFLENFFSKKSIGDVLFSGEAFLLLVYCLLYYLSKMKSDSELMSGPDFYVVTGLSIFVVVNFFVFLFYDSMMNYSYDVADQMWSFHNAAYILFCLLVAKAFSLARKNTAVHSV